jgi:hypothetical protein
MPKEVIDSGAVCVTTGLQQSSAAIFQKLICAGVIGRACIYLNVATIAAKAWDVDCSQIFQLWLN